MGYSFVEGLFKVSVYAFLVIWAIWWAILIVTTLIQSIFPKSEGKAEDFLQSTSKPLSVIYKYIGITALTLLLALLLLELSA